MRAKHGGSGLARLGMALALAIAGAAEAALAQGRPNADNGRLLAERVCVACHNVGSGVQGSTVAADIPSFAAIAARPGHTASTIADRIIAPHPPMPEIALTRAEIADLAAYIISLRK